MYFHFLGWEAVSPTLNMIKKEAAPYTGITNNNLTQTQSKKGLQS